MRIGDLTELYFAKQTSVDVYSDDQQAFVAPIFSLTTFMSPLSSNYDIAVYGTDINKMFRLADDTDEIAKLENEIYGIWVTAPMPNSDGYFESPDYITYTPVKKFGRYYVVDIKAQK